MRSSKSLALGFLVAVVTAFGATAQPRERHDEDQLARDVHTAIVRLPRYGVFDAINFRTLRGNDVVLSGYVYNATLKQAAREEVREIPGIGRVIDRIQVLPVSQYDDRLRRAVFRKLYSDGYLGHYGTPTVGARRGLYGRGRGASPLGLQGIEPLGNYAVHIVVSRGRVSLFGVVSSDADRTRADFAARSVPGVFAVENNIEVQPGR
jgi:hyperosmotically inducible periplasmic protein